MLMLAGEIVAAEPSRLNEQISAFAESYNAGDWKKLGMIHASDAISIPPNLPPAEGRNDIVKLWLSFKTANIRDLSFLGTRIVQSGNIAHQIGTYSMTAYLENDQSKVTGHFLAVWSLNSQDGQWLLTRFSWNVTPEP